MSLHARGLNLDVDYNRLADSRNRFGALPEYQIEIAAFKRLRCDRPTSLLRVVRDRAEQFHM